MQVRVEHGNRLTEQIASKFPMFIGILIGVLIRI